MTDDFWNPPPPPWVERLERVWPGVLVVLTLWVLAVMLGGTMRWDEGMAGGSSVASLSYGMDRIDLRLVGYEPRFGEGGSTPLAVTTPDAATALTDIQFARSRNAATVRALRQARETNGTGDTTSGTRVSGDERVASPTPPVVVADPQPATQCDRIAVPGPGPVYLTANTMRWCATVAAHLNQYDWRNGDLTRLMYLIQCESGGNPDAVNPSSGTSGLLQHRPVYWANRSARAGHPGDRFDPHNNIGVGVWLAKVGQGWWAWDGCMPKLRSTFETLGIWP